MGLILFLLMSVEKKADHELSVLDRILMSVLNMTANASSCAIREKSVSKIAYRCINPESQKYPCLGQLG